MHYGEKMFDRNSYFRCTFLFLNSVKNYCLDRYSNRRRFGIVHVLFPCCFLSVLVGSRIEVALTALFTLAAAYELTHMQQRSRQFASSVSCLNVCTW